VHNENGRSPFPIVANQADNSIPRALAADTAAADTAYGTGKFLAWIIGKRITYRYGVAGSGDQLALRFRGSNHIDASINLVLRSALIILRRPCPTWGARLEGLRASRRTATSKTEPAAILRDGAPQVGFSRLAHLMCRSR
jgi:hypothetical protein